MARNLFTEMADQHPKSQTPLLVPRDQADIWKGSEEQKSLSIFLLTFPRGEEGDQSPSVAQSTFNVATMAMIADCAALLNR
jgi:hypothetical protein